MADKNPEGRPTKYKPEYPRMARTVLESSGFSIPKLAKMFDVMPATIYNWMGEHAEFLEAVRQGRKIFDGIRIEKSLVRRATGYRYTETTSEIDPETKLERITKKVKKTHPPDVAAIKHWQANMDPDHWRDRKTIDGELTISQAIKELEEDGRPTPND